MMVIGDLLCLFAVIYAASLPVELSAAHHVVAQSGTTVKACNSEFGLLEELRKCF